MEKVTETRISRFWLLVVIVSVVSLFSTTYVQAQESEVLGTDGNFSFSSSLFGEEVPRAETSARIGAWDPANGVGLLAVRYVYPEGYHQIDDAEFFTLVPESAPGVVFGSTLKAKPVIKDGLREYFDETTVVLEFRTDPDTRIESLRVNALFQICNEEGTCLFPDSEFHEVPFKVTDPASEADSIIQAVLQWNEDFGAEIESGVSVNESASAGYSGKLWLFLLMALIGGVLLNVMPCVLPLLSVKALGLVKQAGADRRAILRHSWLYVAGIEVSFWILAAIVITLQASGRLLGWGFQFQSPAFVLILIAVIWVFALSMFDVFVIEAPRKGMEGASAAGARGGYLGSFLTGIFAVLVATPCTAPFLGAALGFAFSQPPMVIVAIFSVTGLGLGLPFLLLGLWPGLIQRLPKPGAWMNTFKEVMGFLLFGTAVYLFTTFVRLAPAAVNGALWWILILGFASWLLGKSRNPAAKRWFRRIGQLSALVIAVAGGILFVDLSAASDPVSDSVQIGSKAKNDAIPFAEEDILARIESGQPIFLEFTAAWCTTCKINQRVINDRAVQEAFESKDIAHIKGDLTAYDSTLTRWLADFGRAGVPLYVLYRNGEEPILFPELISVDMLLQEMELVED